VLECSAGWPRGTLYPHTLALTSSTSGCLWVGIVRSRTKATEFFSLGVGVFCVYIIHCWCKAHWKLSCKYQLFLAVELAGCCHISMVPHTASWPSDKQALPTVTGLHMETPVPALAHLTSRCTASVLRVGNLLSIVIGNFRKKKLSVASFSQIILIFQHRAKTDSKFEIANASFCISNGLNYDIKFQ
jgi:hypothetical protein